jgi:CRISPR-associated protein Csd1
MILTRLAEQYDRLVVDPESGDELPTLGESLQKITFEVLLEANGTLVDVLDLRDHDGSRAIPKRMRVLGEAKPSGSGLNPCFLWDNSQYMLGLKSEDAKPDRTKLAREAFRDRHVDAAANCGDEELASVATFLEGWDPSIAVGAVWNDDRLNGFGVFRVRGATHYVHESPRVVKWWMDQLADLEGEVGVCLATGELQHIARTHNPPIKGAGGQSSGTRLVSFNDNAYVSYGHEQSYNAPVGQRAVFRYANALNALLNDRRRCVKLGDVRVVFWAEAAREVEDALNDILGPSSSDDTNDDTSQVAAVRTLLTQLRDGVAADRVLTPGLVSSRFFILGVAPNASRLSVQLWLDDAIGNIYSRIATYLNETALAGGRHGDELLTIRSLVRACGRARKGRGGRLEYDADSVPPRLTSDLARAVLAGTPYPQNWLNHLVGRLRADGAITHARVAGIKAWLTRNSRRRDTPAEAHMALNQDETDEGYLMGRLFALLEKSQEDSVDGELNATIRDRYYSSASATPAVAFPRLLRLGQHHLAKLSPGLKVTREKQMGEVMEKVRRFPGTLRLEQQGMFAIGYYHQRQALFTPRASQENPANE